MITSDGSNILINYVEPSVNLDGSPLTDFKQVRAEVTWPDGSTVSRLHLASSPTGGQPMVMIIPIPANAQGLVNLELYAEDEYGNYGPAVVGSVVVDSLPPAPIILST